MSEVVGNFSGPWRGRIYGPLIKSGNRAIIRTARCYEGFPVYHENHELGNFLLIPLLLSDSVCCEGFEHKIIYGPSLRCNGGYHAMNHNAGLRLYIRPLDGQPMCPGLDEIRARSPH